MDDNIAERLARLGKLRVSKYPFVIAIVERRGLLKTAEEISLPAQSKKQIPRWARNGKPRTWFMSEIQFDERYVWGYVFIPPAARASGLYLNRYPQLCAVGYVYGRQLRWLVQASNTTAGLDVQEDAHQFVVVLALNHRDHPMSFGVP